MTEMCRKKCLPLLLSFLSGQIMRREEGGTSIYNETSYSSEEIFMSIDRGCQV